MRTIILLFLVSLPFTCLPQIWGENNAVWHYSQTMFMPPFTHPYIKFTVTGDTLINGEQAKIFKEEKISINDTSYIETYMKSDSNRVYVFSPELNSFQLIYDFNALPGDTVHVFRRVPKDPLGNDTITIVVDSLSTLEVNGETLNVQHVRQVHSFDDKYNLNGEIIEHIGWTGFMFPLHAWADPPYGGILRCFQNDSIHLKLSEVDCDYTGYRKSKLVIPNKKWIYLIAGSYPDTAIYTDWRYKIGNDTIVDGTEYKNLLFAQNSDNYNGLIGFIREEENGKVYFKRYSKSEEQEYLLYDFGMEVGDTARLGYFNSFHRLDSTDRNIDGKKVYYFTGSQFGTDIWIEGVGSTRGLLKEQIVGGAKMFSCCLLGGEQLYHNPRFESCYFNGYKKLTVDAGNDTTYCTGKGIDSLFLGVNALIKNGTAPYSISWECKVPKGLNTFFTASDLLSDTTILSPQILYAPSNAKWINFVLHITDSVNNYAMDSIKVRFSKFAYLTGYSVHELYKGDSILFQSASIGGGIAPLKFHWQPIIGLLNPDTLVTWCYTDSLVQWRTQYDIIATDSCGCVSYPNLVYEIRVTDTTRVSSKKVALAQTKCFFSGSGLTVERTNDLPWRLIVTTLTGQVLHISEYTERYLNLTGLGLKPQALYLVTVSDSNRKKTFKLLNR